MEKAVTDCNMAVAREYLLRDRLLHIDILEGLRRGNANLRCASHDGVLAVEDSGYVLLSASTPELGDRLLALAEGDSFCVRQSFVAARLRERGEPGFYLECMPAAYFRREPPPKFARAEVELRTLKPDMAEWVNANYRQDPGELDYVRWLLERGVITGAFKNGECVGFIGRHSDGSMGLLEVLPHFRGHGVALTLFRDAICRELSAGNVPYSQITVGNEASLRLHRKLGCEVGEDSRYWWMDFEGEE